MNEYYLNDREATKLFNDLNNLYDKFRLMAKDDPNIQINIWYVIDALDNLRKGIFWGFKGIDHYSDEQEILREVMDIIKTSSDFIEIKRRINDIKPDLPKKMESLESICIQEEN